MIMKSNWLIKSVVAMVLAAFPVRALAHCQVPCGIYDDTARFTMMREHVTTIEKAMTEINAINESEVKNLNQLVRWVNNKEKHADELAEIVTAYFMAQRTKPASPDSAADFVDYQKRIVALHHMLIGAMKAKQSTDIAQCEQLRAQIAAFEQLYLGK
jgi:nickel superoxide dismutase